MVSDRFRRRRQIAPDPEGTSASPNSPAKSSRPGSARQHLDAHAQGKDAVVVGSLICRLGDIGQINQPFGVDEAKEIA